jgi:hypothetical protein
MIELMRWTIGLALVGAVGCGVGPSGTGGAAGGAGTTGSGGTSGSGGTGSGLVCPGDPADGPVPASDCGIWVSTSLGDDANDGSQAAPVATLTHAIELAAKGPGRVYACGGETWPGPVTVPGNVSLHGGFDCAAGWAYVGKEKRASVVSATPLGLIWDSGEVEQTWFTDFHVEAGPAVEPGGSSMAVFVRGNVPLDAERCYLVAGDAMDGADGAPGGDTLAPSGIHGADGAAACSAPVSKGGATTETVCDVGSSKGGAGGDAGPMVAADGADGEPLANPPAGSGGAGQQAAPSCTVGQPGAIGKNGEYGLGAWGRGRLTVDGYIGLKGKDGAPGTTGQGGGGGGASFGKAAVCGAANPGGAAGGSGGSGGCGGKEGQGGQAGGASVAFASRSQKTVTIAGSVFVAGRGGNGGNGGKPQAGGKAALPGQGGAGMGSIAPGCAGGPGGPGGSGGWGGGGMGGPSAAVAQVLDSPVGFDVDQQVIVGLPGEGGHGEDMNNGTTNGGQETGTYVIFNQ